MKFCLLLLLIISPQAFANKIITVLNENNKISQSKITEYIQWVSPHIKSYPPKFKDKTQQKDIYLSSVSVLNELKKISLDDISNVDNLVDIAYIFSMGHNLDLGTATLASKYFKKAIKLDPNNIKANYMYGMFLVSTKKYFYDSIPFLEKAFKLGNSDAGYTLGLIYIRKGEKQKGMKMLMKYSKNNPKNTHVKNIIKSIQKETIRFNESN